MNGNAWEREHQKKKGCKNYMCWWHVVQKVTKSTHSFPRQPEQEHQGKFYTQARTKLKQLNEDGEHKKGLEP